MKFYHSLKVGGLGELHDVSSFFCSNPLNVLDIKIDRNQLTKQLLRFSDFSLEI